MLHSVFDDLPPSFESYLRILSWTLMIAQSHPADSIWNFLSYWQWKIEDFPMTSPFASEISHAKPSPRCHSLGSWLEPSVSTEAAVPCRNILAMFRLGRAGSTQPWLCRETHQVIGLNRFKGKKRWSTMGFWDNSTALRHRNFWTKLRWKRCLLPLTPTSWIGTAWSFALAGVSSLPSFFRGGQFQDVPSN